MLRKKQAMMQHKIFFYETHVCNIKDKTLKIKIMQKINREDQNGKTANSLAMKDLTNVKLI